MRHQVSLADHTESPPPADSLLGPKCHPADSILSLIDDPTGSASDTPAFPRLLRPYPLLRPQPLFPHPESLFHVRRPVQCSRIQHDHFHSLVFRSFKGSTSCGKGLLSRAWNQTLTLHVNGALLPSEGRHKTCMWNSMCSSCMSWPGYKYDGDNDLGRPVLLIVHPRHSANPPKLRLDGTKKSIQPLTLAIANSGKGAKHACLPYPEDELECLVGFKS